MQYRSAKAYVRTGDVLAFRPCPLTWNPLTWFSNLIPLWTLSRYSHVGIAVWVQVEGIERPELAVIEALEGHGIRLHSLRDYVQKNLLSIDLYKTLYTVENGQSYRINPWKVAEYAMSRRGGDYAPPRQFLRSFFRVGRLYRKWRDLPPDVDDERDFCSELVARSLIYGGFPSDHADMKPPSEMSPGDITLLPCLRRSFTIEPDKE